MDLKMKAQDISNEGVYWDCDVENGNVPIIIDDKEDLQCATLAGFLVKGTVPQLAEAGVPWTDFLTGKIDFGVLDYYVRQSILNVGEDNYYPEYDIDEDQLTMKVGKIETEDTDVI
jgi:hypothetical protein